MLRVNIIFLADQQIAKSIHLKIPLRRKNIISLQHTIKQGDSLWSLASRYLGDGTRWRMIYDHHNNEVARFGPQPQNRIFAIDDPDLIFVGQTLWIPPHQKVMPPGTGEKSKAKKIATPVNLKLNTASAVTRPRPSMSATWSNLTSRPK